MARDELLAAQPWTAWRAWTARHLWTLVLLVGLVAAAPILVSWGRDQWFFLDEWAFLVNRRLTDIPSVLGSHNGHWVTLPLVAYRVLYRVFGMRSYVPYETLAVLVHLLVVAMIWLTMRRLRVRPAIATTTALPFAFYGAGRLNVHFGFQVALTGAIVFGLAQLLVATVDDPTTGRDLAGVGLGLAALMCSAVGIPMVVGVSIAVLIRRGWRAMLTYAAPLGVVYVAWYLAYSEPEPGIERSLGLDTFAFVWRMGEAAFRGLGQNGLVGIALGAIALIGIIRAAIDARGDRHGAVPAIVVALVASALVFAALTAYARAETFGTSSATTDRYIYVFAALLLPVVGVGATALARRWVVLGALPLVLLAIGLPRNVELVRHPDGYTLGAKMPITVAAHSPLLEQLPPETRLFSAKPYLELGPTAGFLRAAAASGRLPELHGVSPRDRLGVDGYLALHQRTTRTPRSCPSAGSPQHLSATRGTRIVFSGSLTIVLRRGRTTSTPLRFQSENGSVIDVRAGPVDLTITGPFGSAPAICRIGPS